MIHGLPEMIAARVLNSIFAGLAIAALAWVGLKAFNKHGPGVRFTVWFLTLVGIAALPFVPSFQHSTSCRLPLHTGLTLPGTWAAAILSLWAAALVLIALRFAVGLWNVWKLKREATPVDAAELPNEAELALEEFR